MLESKNKSRQIFKHLTKDNNELTNKTDTTKKKTFFANIGPNLVAKIPIEYNKLEYCIPKSETFFSYYKLTSDEFET